MWSSRLFWKLFLANAALIALVVGVCTAIVAGWQEEQLVEQVHRRLHDSAMLLKEHIRREPFSEDNESLQRKIRNLGQRTKTRFTIVDAQGKVLADSEQATLDDVRAMDNHLQRQELVQANHTGSGDSRRLSPTLRVPYLYFALAIEADGTRQGYVRAAQPIASLLAEVAAIRRLIWQVGLGVVFVGLVLSYALTQRLLHPIQTLTTAAESLARGEPPRRLGVPRADELGTLARAFEHMVVELETRQNALRATNGQQAAVLGGMVEGVLAVDGNERVLFANEAAGRILGFAPDEAVEHTLLEVVRSNDLHEIVRHTLRQREFVRSEIDWQATKPRRLIVNATPLPGDCSAGVVLVLHDVTELNRLENLRQQFVANVSHELKTPLSSIKAYTETLLGGAIDDKKNARRFLQCVDDQANRLHELILDMLALARIESDGFALELTDVCIHDVAEKCVQDHRARAQSAEISLIDETGSSDWSVHADEESLQQILDNLVDNALKYTPAGGTVTLRSRRAEADPRMAEIEVADTGPGIDPAHHERVFERFYRVDKARSRALGGTGLGLAIVKHLCQAMGGSASVENRPGGGTIVRVLVPLATGNWNAVDAPPADS